MAVPLWVKPLFSESGTNWGRRLRFAQFVPLSELWKRIGRRLRPARRSTVSGDDASLASLVTSGGIAMRISWIAMRIKDMQMSKPPRFIPAALLVAAAVALAAAAVLIREKRQTAELTVENIHAQLDALDPVTRAAVIARLSSDEVKKVRDQRR